MPSMSGLPWMGMMSKPKTEFINVNRETGCWEWIRAHTPKGYGVLRIRGSIYYAHRWMYENLVGPIPAGLTIDHLCRNHACVRPAHLEPVTRKENFYRGEHSKMAIRRNGVCLRGHSEWYENPKTGHRQCRACTRIWMRAHYGRGSDIHAQA